MGWGSSAVSTIIGFGLSMFIIVLIFTKLLCRRLHGAGPQPLSELDLDPRIDVEQPQHRAPGVEPVQVVEIPTAKFSRDTFGMEDAQCSICLGEYEEREVLRIMPKCGHSFHLVCIDTWLLKKSTCPVCRRSLKDLIGMEGTDPGIVNLSRFHQWHLPGAENSERSRSHNPNSERSRSHHPVRPDLSSPTSPPAVIPIERETGR